MYHLRIYCYIIVMNTLRVVTIIMVDNGQDKAQLIRAVRSIVRDQLEEHERWRYVLLNADVSNSGSAANTDHSEGLPADYTAS